jgi:hypothetical protein
MVHGQYVNATVGSGGAGAALHTRKIESIECQAMLQDYSGSEMLLPCS